MEDTEETNKQFDDLSDNVEQVIFDIVDSIKSQDEACTLSSQEIIHNFNFRVINVSCDKIEFILRNGTYKKYDTEFTVCVSDGKVTHELNINA
jgi:hypothetical protein